MVDDQAEEEEEWEGADFFRAYLTQKRPLIPHPFATDTISTSPGHRQTLGDLYSLSLSGDSRFTSYPTFCSKFEATITSALASN